jgi:hypothetical protein
MEAWLKGGIVVNDCVDGGRLSGMQRSITVRYRDFEKRTSG